MRYSPGQVAPAAFKKLCDGVHREAGVNAATARMICTWPDALTSEASRAAICAVREDRELLEAVGVDPELIYTLGEGEEVDGAAVVPYTVWYMRRDHAMRSPVVPAEE
jgi:hypothetical protein